MDVVNDLSSQAVSFLSIIQDICKENLYYKEENNTSAFFYDKVNAITDLKGKCSINEKQQIGEVIWISNKKNPVDADLNCFLERAKELVSWLRLSEELLNKGRFQFGTLYSTPYEWRESIRFILYEFPDVRETLVKILHYIPIQIVLAAGGGTLSAYDQHLLQVWDTDGRLNLTSTEDEKKIEEWWGAEYNGTKRAGELFKLLKNDRDLLNRLNREKVPVPFDTILIDELSEIKASRRVRLKEQSNAVQGNFEEGIFGREKHDAVDSVSRHSVNDPLHGAKSMGLYALAFSGGGIRSATFNLGILQKLGEEGLLEKFDYLSTVSGGGYIGSWLASWIFRAGSISKVADRLNPEKSAEPLAEEVRPIRWLRMFSNYLSPNASIMSADAWTMGISWIRNTIINQVILLMLLCAALAGIKCIFNVWDILNGANHISDGKVLYWSMLIFFPAAVMAGLGMYAYNPMDTRRSLYSRQKSKKLASLLLLWGILSAFLVSSWLYAEEVSDYSVYERAVILWPACLIGFTALLIVAVFGRYDRCAAQNNNKFETYFFIFFSSLIAAVSGLFLLAYAWQILDYIKCIVTSQSYLRDEVGFVIGPPLILEVISIIVVVRMAFMGRIFPDERREWWGRMGALVHRFMLVWILVSAAVLLLHYSYPFIIKHISWGGLYTLVGGWSAIISYAVKLAFNPETSGDKPTKGSLSSAELFVRFAPYIFGLGFLVLGSHILYHITKDWEHDLGEKDKMLKNATLAILLGGVTLFVSWRIGVNEFSLHLLYRNRLVRAYLGATRSRAERGKTFNSFTGFDKLDDLKLVNLVVKGKDNKDGYSGPYPIINTALNATDVTDLDRQDRKAESFIFTPKYCGFDFSRTRAVSRSMKKAYDYGYRPTSEFSDPQGPNLGTAMAISGAAVSPNMGYHSSPATAFLLTIFNVRLGWWIGNPRKAYWEQSDPQFGIAYLIKDLIGKSDTSSNFVCLSDGGHFDDMGIYELIRRRCKYILLCDAEEDVKSTCVGLANAIRRCRIDFGVQIEIDLKPVTNKNSKTGFSKQHKVKGTIWYPGDSVNAPSGILAYVKTSLTGNEAVDVREYFMDNPAFPQQSTDDQFFDESQFESYRKLGFASL
jgi:hypothetical protein